MIFSEVTKLDRLRNERIRGTAKVGEKSMKVQEVRLTWYQHALRREEEYVGMRVMVMEVPGKRRRGRPKRRWLGIIRNDFSKRELSWEEDHSLIFPPPSITRYSFIQLSELGCCGENENAQISTW